MTLVPASSHGAAAFNGGTITQPLSIATTDPLAIPETITGAHNQNTSILKVQSFAAGTVGLDIEGDGADGVDTATLAADGPVSLQSSASVNIVATGEVKTTAVRLIYSHATAAPASGLAAGDFAFWFDQTAAAPKLMVYAKDINGTVVTAAIALS